MDVNPQNNPSQNPDRRQITASFDGEYQRLTREFELLIQQLDAEYVFEILVTQFLLGNSSRREASEIPQTPAQVELAAFYLYPRFGRGGSRDHKLIQDFFDLLEQLHMWRGLAAANQAKSNDMQVAMLQIHLLVEAELVRGSTYAPLLRKRIEGIQCPFEDWFKHNAGVGPCRALQIVDAYLKVINENFKEERRKLMGIFEHMDALRQKLKRKPGEAETIDAKKAELTDAFTGFLDNTSLHLAPSFTQIQSTIGDLTESEWISLQVLIGLTFETRKELSGPQAMRGRPVYFLSGNRILLLDVSCVYDALFEAYDSITRIDEAPIKVFRDKKYAVGLSHWMEDQVPQYFGRIFPKSAIFSNLTYPDPNHPGGETELDAAILWGPFLVLCEIKGKRYRPKSRLGDLARLKSDLEDNIEEAFQQATRAITFIESGSISTFEEKASGRKMTVDRSSVRTIFPMSVTLHDFGAIATQLALLKNIGMFRNSAYPWSLCLANLGIVTSFAKSPDVFLHYAQRRLDLQRSGKNIQADEIELFGHYLDTRLHPSIFWERKTEKGREFDTMHLDGATERFDQWFRVEGGSPGQKPDISIKIPPLVHNLLEGLRQNDDYECRWIAHTILSLSPSTLERINANLEKLYKTASDEKFMRATFVDSGIVVSFVVGFAVSPEILKQHTIRRTNLEKYRHKANMSVGIGIDAAYKGAPFEFACWSEGEWVEDPRIEDLLRMDTPTLLPGQKLPGRNEPCICGSKKKFKKCCLHKLTKTKTQA